MDDLHLIEIDDGEGWKFFDDSHKRGYLGHKKYQEMMDIFYPR